MSIGQGEVNSNAKTNLTATKHILKERVSWFNIQLGKSHFVFFSKELLFLVSHHVFAGPLFHLSKSKRNLSAMLVLSTLR